MGNTGSKKDETKDVRPIRTLEGIKDLKWALKRQSQRDYILFLLGINTGLRITDLLELKVQDVRGKKSFMIKEGKTDKPRKLYLKSESLYKELNSYCETVKSEWLFPSRKGDKAISRIQAYEVLRQAADTAGIEHVGTHTMRKTFGYWHYKQFKDVAKLQHILNHSKPSITLQYIGITDEEIEETFDNFSL